MQLGGRLHGTVALSDVHDVYVANALSGLQEGGFVRACILATNKEGNGTDGKLPRVTLSLRSSDNGALPDSAAAVGVTAMQVCMVCEEKSASALPAHAMTQVK